MILEMFVVFLASALTEAQKVKLKEVDTLTLYRGKLTNGRRSSPVQQLACRGGSAGCTAFVPDVVQCYNRGSDGLETQWECKTEMPTEFKFGKIQVSCEGYDYPDDPYILAGSCGLEYTIDRTGVNSGSSWNNQQNNGYSSNGWNSGQSYQGNEDDNSFGLLIIALIGMLIIYKCLNPTQDSSNNQQPYNPDYIPPAGTTPNQPPPPYTEHSTYQSPRRSNWSWGSFGAGWIANSFFNSGNRTREPRYRQTRQNSPSPARRSSSNSGTRMASGFGGTSRR